MLAPIQALGHLHAGDWTDVVIPSVTEGAREYPPT